MKSFPSLRRFRSLTLAGAALLLFVSCVSAQTVAQLTEANFMIANMPNVPAAPYILPHGDVIAIHVYGDGDIPDGEVRIGLQLGRDIRTWKEIKVAERRPGSTDLWTIKSISAGRPTNDPYFIQVSRDDLLTHGLWFAKAQLGIHTDVYFYRPDFNRLSNLGRNLNTIVFIWNHDNWQPREPGLDPRQFKTSAGPATDRYLLEHGDVILLGVGHPADVPLGVPGGEVEIVLQTTNNITWWKQVKLRMWGLDAEGRLTTRYRDLPPIETRDDDHGPRSFRVNRDEFFARGQLIFSKAGFLGHPGEVYKVWGSDLMLAHDRPSQLVFTWQRD